MVGRLPSNTLCGSRLCRASPAKPAASSSARASSVVLPRISASVWAKTFDNRIGWCSPIGLWLWHGAMKSQGISFVPWWMSW